MFISNKALGALVVSSILLQGCGSESSSNSPVTATAAVTCPSEQFVKFANNNYCSSTTAPEKIFILIDGTDGFPSGSKSWIKENIFNKTNITWTEEGAEISIAFLGDKPVAELDVMHVCLPKHVSKINKLIDNVGSIKRGNNVLHCTVNETADRFLNADSGAARSVLIEAVAEVFKNPKYRFGPTRPSSGVRKFYFISDLFQNSKTISFYKSCKTSANDGVITCPSYESLINNNARIERYLKEAMPDLNATDEIYLYNINIANRIDQSARAFWEQYFIVAGALATNITYRAELSQ